MITIYTKSTPCAYCDAAKMLLDEHGLDYREIIADRDDDTKKLFRERVPAEIKTVPQIFLNEERIGGYNELRKRIFEVVGVENL